MCIKMRNYFSTFVAMMVCMTFATSIAFCQWDSVLWNSADKNIKIKDYISAYDNMDQLVKKSPDAAIAYYNRGIVLFRIGDLDQACRDLKKARDMKLEKVSVPTICDKNLTRISLNDFFYKGQKLDPALGYRPYYSLKDTLRGMLRPERTCFDVTFYDLTVRIIPRNKSIRGNNKITFNIVEPTSRIQLDLFANMKIDSICWNSRHLSYTRQFDAVFVIFPETLKPGSRQQLAFYYHGKPSKAVNPPWQGGFVWKREHLRQWDGVSCEQFGASCWWPCKDHLSDEPDSQRINLEVPRRYQAISNGTFISTSDAGMGVKRYTWFVHYPINNYNVTFYLGKFAHFSDTVQFGKDVIKLEYYVLPRNLEKAKAYFLQTKDVVRIYSDIFGVYPFIKDKFALIESPFAGMEHQNAIAYGNEYGKDAYHYYINNDYDYIIVHEAAHEWWGNSVSAGDLADAWIHESFATYAEVLFMERKYGYEKGYLTLLRKYREQIMNFWPMVDHYGVNEYSFASNDIYMKGAAVLDNLRCTINDDQLFFKILKDFQLRYKCKVVKTEDFVNFVNEYTHENYTPFFKKFLYETTLPVLNYSYKKEGNDVMLTYRWDGVDNGFKMPFCIRIDGSRNVRLVATTSDQTIKLENTKTFNFYTQWVGFAGVDRNSYTYYWTHKAE
jgi:aminopeptidase N